MALVTNTVQARIISGKGDTTDNRWRGAANRTWVKGQFLRKLSDGTVETVAAVATTGIHLVAEETVATATTGFVSVTEILAGTVFEGQTHHATPASSPPASSQKGGQFRLEATDGIMTVDLEEATTPDLEVTDVYPDWASYDTGGDQAGNFGIVRFKVIESRINVAPQSS